MKNTKGLKQQLKELHAEHEKLKKRLVAAEAEYVSYAKLADHSRSYNEAETKRRDEQEKKDRDALRSTVTALAEIHERLGDLLVDAAGINGQMQMHTLMISIGKLRAEAIAPLSKEVMEQAFRRLGMEMMSLGGIPGAAFGILGLVGVLYAAYLGKTVAAPANSATKPTPATSSPSTG